MSRYLTYTFPAGNTSDVCQAQNTAAAANLILNGNLVNSTGSEVNFLSQGYSRSISLSSAGNLSAARFTVNGIQNGVALSISNITGPNANTVYITDIFDVVTSISVNGAVNDIRIGTGYSGYFPLLNINLERDVINYSFNTAKLTASSISTVVFGTLKNVYQNGHTFADIIANDFNIFSIKAAAADIQYIFPVPGAGLGLVSQPLYKFILISINGSSGTISNSIQMNFIQT